MLTHVDTVPVLQGTMDRKNIEKLATEDLLLKFLENKWACCCCLSSAHVLPGLASLPCAA